jgi:23S rRNA (adenine2030-N6)-methyltransferase
VSAFRASAGNPPDESCRVSSRRVAFAVSLRPATEDPTLNYRHAFHAGNFGDVLKHVVLVGLLERLAQKDKPFFFLDTHAGRGRYDLEGEAARKSGEAQAGILRLAAAPRLPPLAARYVALVRGFDAANAAAIRCYPGSPRLAAMLMRPDDRAALCELAPREAEGLRREFCRDPRFAIHLRDGYESLRALLPPRERRGLVLLDPPYESQESELTAVADALAVAQRRWPQGVFAAWYPVKRAATTAAFLAGLAARGVSEALVAELSVHPPDSSIGLNGSGMVVLNPPWQLDEELAETLPAVHAALAPAGSGGSRVEWLVPEAASRCRA